MNGELPEEPGPEARRTDAGTDDRTEDRIDDGTDGRLDSELAAAGATLRRDAAAVDGYRVMTGALRRRVTRARRNSAIAVGVAAAMLAALVGFTVTDSDRAEVAAGRSGVFSAEPGTPEAIVAKLPADPVDPRDVKLVSTVSRFDSCDALLQSLRTVGAAHVGSRGFGQSGDQVFQMAATGSATASDALSSSALSPQTAATGDTVGTNVIVDGVDEPDSVKATDSLIVDIWGHSLRVVDTAVPGVVGSVALVKSPEPDSGNTESATPSSLLVAGRRAVVFGTELQTPPPVKGDPSASRPAVEYLTVTFVDLSDASAPKVVDRVRMEGRLVAARRVGDQVRIVTSASMGDLPLVSPTTPNSVKPALHQNRLAVAGSSVHDWIPTWDHGRATDAEPLIGCNRVVVPDTFAGVEMTSLVAFDVDGPFAPSATGILAPSEDVTATADDVVVGSHVWVDPSEQGDDFIDWSTALHRFAFDEDGPTYVASGQVTGSIRDDFSLAVLDDGTIAAVTVDVLPWRTADKANVTVRTLRTDATAHTLAEVGSIVAKDSGITFSATRFVGDRLVLSSGLGSLFLSVLDLSDPVAPRDLGSVRLAGAGLYVHPLPAHKVLVVGPGAHPDPSGATDAFGAPVMVSDIVVTMIDITAEPRILAQNTIEGAGTNVTFDHHSFTWWPSRSTAAFDVLRLGSPSEAMFLAVGDSSMRAEPVTPREADLGPRCRPGESPTSGCDPTGPLVVNRVLVVDGQPWLYTSESVEHVDPDTHASLAVVPLPWP